MTDTSNNFETLSPAGIERREEILRQANALARRRRINRAVVRSLGAAIAIGGVAAFAWQFSASKPLPNVTPITKSDPIIAPKLVTSRTPPPIYASFRFSVIEADATRLDAFRMNASSSRTQAISDDQLLSTLFASGVDAGLASMGNQSQLVINNFP